MSVSRRALFQLGLGGFSANFLTGLLAAAEVWDKKPAAEWTQKDIEKLMSKSPWAKRFSYDSGRGPAAFSGPATKGGGGGGGGRGGGPQGGGGDVGDAPGGDGPGGGGGGGMGAAPEALVRWETAVPILAAQKRELPESFKGMYAISVAGFAIGGARPGGGGPAGPGGGGPRPGGGPGGPGGGFNPEAMRAAQQAMFETAKGTTHLERKGKDPIAPAVMGMNGRALVILFPQGTQPIQLEDKDVTLVLKVGDPEMKAKFSLKDMVYMGQLTL